jgi:hypothetical protein
VVHRNRAQLCTTKRANPFPPCRGKGLVAIVGPSVNNRK